MNAYEKAQQLGLTGTDQNIVDKLKALSTSNIDASKVRLWLSDKGLLTYDGTSWFGSLETKLPKLTTELQAGIRDLKARVLSGHPIRTAEIEHAPKVLLILTGITVAMPEVAGLVAGFYALDGGRPYLTTTVEEFAAQRSAAALQAEKQAVVASCRTTVNALAAKATAVNAWLDALDLSTKTVQELQEYCDALLASETGNP